MKTIEKAAVKSRAKAKHADSPITNSVRPELVEGFVPLSTVVTLNPRKFTTPITDEDIVSFVPMKCVEEETGNLDATILRPWREVKKGYTAFQDNDVIFAKITPCMENGKFAIARGLKGGRAAGSTEFHVLRPNGKLAPHYLMHFLFQHHIRQDARMNMRGAAGQLRVPTDFFASLKIPLPTLSTQHRIVAEIEEKLSRLDAAQYALLRAQANLKRYRLSVLNAAITGAYSEPVKSSNTYLSKLLAAHKSEWRGRGKYKEPATPNVPKGAQLPSGWVWASLDQLLGHVTDGDHQAPPQTAQGIPFLVIGNVRRGKIDLSDTRFVSTDYFNQLDRARVPRKGDLLYTLVGSYGIPVPVDVDEAFCIQRHMGILRPHSMSPMAYLQLAMASDFVFQQATAVSTGTAQRTVPLAGLRRMAIPLPAPELQNQIVEEVERRLSVIDRTEQTLRTQLARAKRLRQSILQQAFTQSHQPQ